jgi:hypothetical protein
MELAVCFSDCLFHSQRQYTDTLTTVFLLYGIIPSYAFNVTPRPAIVRIVALPMSDPQESTKLYDYFEFNSDENEGRSSVSAAAPSFDEYLTQRAGSNP